MNNVLQPNFRNCSRDIAAYGKHFGFQQWSGFQLSAQWLSFYEFPREVWCVSTGHVTTAMLNQARQVRMRDVLHRADLAPYANVLTGIEVQLQCYIVTRRYAVWPRNSGCPENYSLTTNANLGTDDVAPTQRSFYICRDKLEDRPMDSHTIYHVSGRPCLRFLSQNLGFNTDAS
jgi:hypothetical protein